MSAFSILALHSSVWFCDSFSPLLIALHPGHPMVNPTRITSVLEILARRFISGLGAARLSGFSNMGILPSSARRTLTGIASSCFPGVGCHGGPLKDCTSSAFHRFSLSASLLKSLALTVPSLVPMMHSPLSSLIPIQTPVSHLESSLSRPRVPIFRYSTVSPNSVVSRRNSLPFHLRYAVFPSCPTWYLLMVAAAWIFVECGRLSFFLRALWTQFFFLQK